MGCSASTFAVAEPASNAKTGDSGSQNVNSDGTAQVPPAESGSKTEASQGAGNGQQDEQNNESIQDKIKDQVKDGIQEQVDEVKEEVKGEITESLGAADVF
eukprot:Nk52_evm3s381 gene=Nk52_evmTU3s381